MVAEKTERKYWALPPEELFKELDSSEDGLSVDEAGERLLIGKNRIAGANRTGELVILGRQLKSPLIWVLILAALVMIILGDYGNTAFILMAVIINTTLGFYQENKAESALSKLGTYIKERARVLREGRDIEIEAEEIVKGDVIRLTPGVRVPADARIFRANG
ncbi:MAG: cation-transporting P-type ATPase, partial [Candidatus Colwellbacteria bacterium]|nr:cation-transporting P-type ATPase [Candidatus Colwellbacteria bacterium]